jgi:hypothetical protein
MGSAPGFWLDFEHLRLTVEPHQDHWQTFVYDRQARLVLYRAERMTVHGAKVAAVEFSVAHLGGPTHGKDPERMAELPVWKLIGKSATQ